jgi:hypothetical protein
MSVSAAMSSETIPPRDALLAPTALDMLRDEVIQDGPSRLVGSARISTDDQTIALKADALVRVAVDVVFQEVSCP